MTAEQIQPGVALQLYTLRHLPGGLDAQLDVAAAAGYAGVELLGDHGLTAAALRDSLTARGLAPAASHVALGPFEADPAAVIAFHQEVGTPLLVVPYLAAEQRPGDAAGWRALGRRLARLGERTRDAGVQLAYHNHDFEMIEVGGKPALDLLVEEAPPELLALELDLAWVVRGGRDPLELLERYHGRCRVVHVKDLAPAGENLDEGGWADVGHGTLDWPALLPAAVAAGARWLVVEHDQPRDPAATARRGRDYLASLGY